MPAFSSSVFLLPSLYFTYKCQNSLISLLASKTHVWICIITESSVFYQKNSIVYFHILFLFAFKSKDVFMLVNQTDLSVMKCLSFALFEESSNQNSYILIASWE